jgi:nucleoside-diphosphate-sugar epimerase
MAYKYFIPGGAGYIGSTLVEILLERGDEVTVVDNFFYGQTSLLHLIRHPKLKVIKGDIRDKILMKECLATANVIIPLAALVGAPLCDREPTLSQEVNFEASRQLIEMVGNHQMVIMPTTNSAYGSGDAANFCDENSPLQPISSYAQMKVELESFLLTRSNAISFRLATVFGVSARMRLDLLVNDFTFRAMAYNHISLFEGHFKRNYIHVRDVVQVFIHAVENFDLMRGQVYNVGLSSANISKLELCQEIQKQIPKFTFTEVKNGRDPDQRNYIVSNAKIEATGYRPIYDLTHGISEVIKAYPLLNEQSMRNI